MWAPVLHKRFEGRDDVVFVNLCALSEPTEWLSAVAKHNIMGENYLLSNDASERFASAYNVQGYPSHLIIARDGRLITNAPWADAAAEKIEELL